MIVIYAIDFNPKNFLGSILDRYKPFYVFRSYASDARQKLLDMVSFQVLMLDYYRIPTLDSISVCIV